MPALAGKTVLITRPRSPADALTRLLRRAGAKAVHASLIKTRPPASYAGLDRALRSQGAYDAAVFASARAVEAFFSRARALRVKPSRPRRLWAVGPETARALRRHGWALARRPLSFNGAALARSMPLARGSRVLIPRAQEGRADLPAILRKKGAAVTLAACYRTVFDRDGQARLKKLARGRIHAVAFASGSSVDAFMSALGPAAGRAFFATAVAAAIGPSTARALRRHGIRAAIQAKMATAEGLARAIIDFYA